MSISKRKEKKPFGSENYLICQCRHPILQLAFNLTWRVKGQFHIENMHLDFGH